MSDRLFGLSYLLICPNYSVHIYATNLRVLPNFAAFLSQTRSPREIVPQKQYSAGFMHAPSLLFSDSSFLSLQRDYALRRQKIVWSTGLWLNVALRKTLSQGDSQNCVEWPGIMWNGNIFKLQPLNLHKFTIQAIPAHR